MKCLIFLNIFYFFVQGFCNYDHWLYRPGPGFVLEDWLKNEFLRLLLNEHLGLFIEREFIINEQSSYLLYEPGPG